MRGWRRARLTSRMAAARSSSRREPIETTRSTVVRARRFRAAGQIRYRTGLPGAGSANKRSRLMIPQNGLTEENEREMRRVRALADALGLRFDEVVRSGSQGTVIGMQSRNLLFSLRLDSRTFFVQDARFGPGLEAGVYEGKDDEVVRVSKTIVEKLGIPSQEIAATNVRREQTQQAEVDPKTGQARLEERRPGKALLRLTRRIEGLPVWSSGITLGLTKNAGIGFLEAHWPEIPSPVIEEAKRLAERIKEGWKAPERTGGSPESVEA